MSIVSGKVIFDDQENDEENVDKEVWLAMMREEIAVRQIIIDRKLHPDYYLSVRRRRLLEAWLSKFLQSYEYIV